ncbi:DUF2975 domain-containing protein [Pelagibacterium xiamenense]|uniref:DUF2975 domain-containing protein n=1 Tax=Pelagibacterium xiamenense TaxID=2901140 RepID=UPI001E655766|nr:DUF2975 domain-containing protein [Pelagibacterium xiamenense]MCD7059066.1 DUF2975 domain-containing protein [Pelagibacterium xiamenense]
MTATVPISAPLSAPVRTGIAALRLGALVAAIVLPVGMALFWFTLDRSGLANLLHIPAGAPRPVGLLERGAGFGLSMIPLGILVFGLIRLRACLAAFLSGAIFSSAASGGLRDFAIAIGASALIKPFIGALLSLVLSWSAPPGQRMIAFYVSSDTILFVLFAGTISAMAWAMQQAALLAEENAQFV